jgi:hypothetical protein
MNEARFLTLKEKKKKKKKRKRRKDGEELQNV